MSSWAAYALNSGQGQVLMFCVHADMCATSATTSAPCEMIPEDYETGRNPEGYGCPKKLSWYQTVLIWRWHYSQIAVTGSQLDCSYIENVLWIKSPYKEKWLCKSCGFLKCDGPLLIEAVSFCKGKHTMFCIDCSYMPARQHTSYVQHDAMFFNKGAHGVRAFHWLKPYNCKGTQVSAWQSLSIRDSVMVFISWAEECLKTSTNAEADAYQ